MVQRSAILPRRRKDWLSSGPQLNSYLTYVHGVPTVVVTDHSALKWILSRGDPPARIAHWVMDLAQYDLTYLYRKGAHNNVADALSRLLRQMDAAAIVNGSEEMPASCLLRAITTRRGKTSYQGRRL